MWTSNYFRMVSNCLLHQFRYVTIFSILHLGFLIVIIIGLGLMTDTDTDTHFFKIIRPLVLCTKCTLDLDPKKKKVRTSLNLTITP